MGDLLDGENAYHCEKCDKHVAAVKRCSIKKLPNMLIVVLKRFDIDYETLMRMKINDCCEFPTKLNMENYTQKYLKKMDEKEK